MQNYLFFRILLRLKRPVIFALIIVLILTGCLPPPPGYDPNQVSPIETASPTLLSPTPKPQVTALPTRQPLSPGELVDYNAQTGDTLDVLAVRFNTTIAEIRSANPIIPQEVTLLPPGMPMKIPIYYLPLWGSPYQIIPDELFINGPAQVGFDTDAFINRQPGWLKGFHGYTSEETLTPGQTIDRVALDYSVSPRLLLAMMEYATGALSQPTPPDGAEEYPAGAVQRGYSGLYMQLIWVANNLNNHYYDIRAGLVTQFDHLDGTMERPDPWQNAASVALHMFYAQFVTGNEYLRAISSVGLAQTYASLFGDPWKDRQPHLPGSLRQPKLQLPFQTGKYWTFTGGPHTGWGTGAPFAAIDFAPPAGASGCIESDEWATAVAPGVIVRAEPGLAVLDLDGDGDEHTGWTILYLHTILDASIVVGKKVKAGDIIGHPSCERGRATGTHVHIARKFNGEWMPAGGAIPFNLEGWVVVPGKEAYLGALTKSGRTITACTCSDHNSQLKIGE
ncbi:MAG: LysM peptidoglycan-binding domain-containing M23 family metallopeptidase [Patescibacteria group bacterium]|nr:LysM peptidoglycan-binding domain-containing M23 family metallopeptidase [Patescibacteria group bacterium]